MAENNTIHYSGNDESWPKITLFTIVEMTRDGTHRQRASNKMIPIGKVKSG